MAPHINSACLQFKRSRLIKVTETDRIKLVIGCDFGKIFLKTYYAKKITEKQIGFGRVTTSNIQIDLTLGMKHFLLGLGPCIFFDFEISGRTMLYFFYI